MKLQYAHLVKHYYGYVDNSTLVLVSEKTRTLDQHLSKILDQVSEKDLWTLSNETLMAISFLN